MPLYIEKAPIMIIGMGVPLVISNLLAHRVVDEDTSRIMLLSTIGAELNTLQHFGHNSRKISIRGRINLATSSFVDWSTAESILIGLKMLKETKSAVLVIMNHSVCYGVISKIVIVDDKDLPTAFDYELEIIEKDMYGLRFSAVSQRLLSFAVSNIRTSIPFGRFVDSTTSIPSFIDRGE